MPIVFGGATSDDITLQMGLTLAQSSASVFVYGWWYPTTLTATRGLWSIGNIVGAEIDTTTDELRLRTDNTTDGQWTTTGVDLAVNSWKFIAFYLTTTNTGPAATWVVWAGIIEQPPVECTVTSSVAPSGNFTGNSNFYWGNKGTGTLAFQGEIAHCGVIGYDGTVIGERDHPMYNNAHGTITAVQKQLIYEHFVVPAWTGEYTWMKNGQQRSLTGGTGTPAYIHNALDMGAVHVGTMPGTQSLSTVITINGTTASSQDSPRPLMGTAIQQYTRR